MKWGFDLGKTVQALALLGATQLKPAVVVVPSSLKLNWRREAHIWLPGWSVEVLQGTAARERLVVPDITIVNYDVVHAWAQYLHPKALVFDEFHYCKTAKARRTVASVELGARVHAAGGIVVGLSGTPFVNRAGEIVEQLRIIDRLDDFGGEDAFKARYVGSSKHLPELNKRLRATCYVRRLKADVVKELPPKVWATVYVEGDPKVMVDYRKAEAEFLEWFENQAMRLALEAGATTDDALAEARLKVMKAMQAETLVQYSVLVRLAAKAKMQAAEQWIKDFVASGNKLVVFAHHRDVVDMVASKFADGCKVQGGMADAAKQACVDAFQDDERQKVISCSLTSAGVGITLTAASDVLFLEQGWTPAGLDQASDRCHRIGQTDSVTAWLMMVEGTVDEDVREMINAKRQVVNAATDGSSQVEDFSMLENLIDKLAERAKRKVAA